jgi:hypothetical protein
MHRGGDIGSPLQGAGSDRGLRQCASDRADRGDRRRGAQRHLDDREPAIA